MFRFRKAAFALSIVSCSSLAFAANWGKDRLWNDGRAEVAFYDAARVADDKPRTFKEQIITQKIDLGFKMNVVQKFDSDNFPVSLLTSVLVSEDPVSDVLKIVADWQDWVGSSISEYQKGSTSLDVKAGDLFEDQFPISLRELPFKQDFEKTIRVWSSLGASREVKPQAAEAVLKVTGEEVVRTYAGSLPCWIVKITRSGVEDTYWFEKKTPHILVKMTAADGRKRLLTGRARWSYWDRRIPKPKVLN